MEIKTLLLITILTGCQTQQLLTPINATTAYFGTIALHESGHAITALAIGTNNIDINLLPTTDENNNQHLALTTAHSPNWSRTDRTIFLTAGPTTNLLSHITTSELLKSNTIPYHLQPTIAWLNFGNQLAFYYHAISGMIRIKSTDLGQENINISAILLLIGITYDIYNYISDGFKNFKVMFWQDYYEENQNEQISLIARQHNDGGYLGIRIRW